VFVNGMARHDDDYQTLVIVVVQAARPKPSAIINPRHHLLALGTGQSALSSNHQAALLRALNEADDAQ
jgi:hypothetical protein